MKKSLAKVLAQQWLLYSGFFMVFFIAIMFFFMFVFEDRANEKSLNDMALILKEQAKLTKLTKIKLPEPFSLYALNDVPTKIVEPVKDLSLDEVTEFAEYHLTKFTRTSDGKEYVLIYDSSKADSVWQAADKILILISPILLIFLASAYLLARRFTRKVTLNLDELLGHITSASEPKTLKDYANQQQVTEFANMATKYVDVWQAKLSVIEREQAAVKYLSHELRTPMQVIQNTVDMLTLTPDNPKALQRLHRSVNRLTRISAGIMWLMTNKRGGDESIEIEQVLLPLFEELSPLAEKKGQQFTFDKEGQLYLAIPQEVAEILISNILNNTIQHGASDVISCKITTNSFEVSNSIAQLTSPYSVEGFGIGMELANRLANRFNLQLSLEKTNDNKMRVLLAPK